MKIIITTGLFILLFSETQGQLWKRYADSAKYYYNQRNNDKAIEFSLKAQEKLEKDSVATGSLAVCSYNLANLYADIGQYNKAEPLYLESKQIREKLFEKQHRDYANSCNSLANLYQNMGQYDKAETLYMESKQIREKLFGKEHRDYAASCHNLASLYNSTGKYSKAEPLFLEAKQIQERVLGKKHPDYASACNNLGNLYLDMGNTEKAEPLVLEAKQIREKVLGKEHPDYAHSCNNLAILYSERGQYEKAELLYLEAKNIVEKVFGKGHPDYADDCNNLAILYEDMGQYEKAEHLFLEAKMIREKVTGKESPDYADASYNLAALYKKMKRYEKAEALSLEAKEIRRKMFGEDHPDYGASCNNLANIYSEMGKYEKAEPLYIEAKRIRAKALGKEHRDYASACNNLGTFYYDIGQNKKAEPLYLEAKRIRQKVLGKQHRDYGLTCANLARLYWEMHQPLLAEKEFKEAFAVNSFNLYSVFQFTNEKEKEAFIKNISGEDDIPYSFYASSKIKSDQPYSLSLFHRNLILSASQALNKELFYTPDPSLSNKYYQWMELKKYLSVLYSKPVDERKEDVVTIEAKAGDLEKELTRLSSGFKKQQQRVDWKDIRNKLQVDEASIEFVSFRPIKRIWYGDSIVYMALLLRKDMLPAMIYMFNEKQLTNLLSSTGNRKTNEGVKELYSSRGVSEDSDIVINKSIYQLIWKPLEKELKGIKTIYFAPSGILHRIAFSALPINKKEVLSDRYKLVQLATTATVTDQMTTFITSSDNLRLYGGIKYGDASRSGSFNYLPGTEAEIGAIEKLSKTTQNRISILFGIKATEESFKALDGKASPAVIHIATHGFFFPDPIVDLHDNIQRSFETSGKVFKQSDNPLFRSGLLFAGANNSWKGKPVEGIEDGILTAFEVSNMYFPNTKLVVLSACETALGDIQGSEGVYGLQRAFKIAGVQNLVMSLWKVPDIETGEFMQLFYKNMYAGKSISDAFYLAQTGMKNKYRNDPYKWAAWVMVR